MTTHTPRASIVIAAHNEGDRLWKTIQSSKETSGDLDLEVVIVNDSTEDNSVEEARKRFPWVRVVAHPERRGCAATKDLGARHSRGEVILFLDGHCKPEGFAIARLIEDVKETDGQAIITPRLPSLDCESWENQMHRCGHGFSLELESLEGRWLSVDEMRPCGRFYETPALIGCSLAVSRELYERLQGFDRDMREWGVEDIDFGLKAWLMGHAVLHNPRAIIGHRFRSTFDNFSVTTARVVSNQLRMARKNFSDETWSEWLPKFQHRQKAAVWEKAWALFQSGERSLEEERKYLLQHRTRDEHWFAEHFGLKWPEPSSAHRRDTKSGPLGQRGESPS